MTIQDALERFVVFTPERVFYFLRAKVATTSEGVHLMAAARVLFTDTGEIREQTVFLGDLPVGYVEMQVARVLLTAIEASRDTVLRRLMTRGDQATPQTVFSNTRIETAFRKMRTG